jgi:methylmalonyl-CoA epimerase
VLYDAAVRALRIDHVALATDDLEGAVARWTALFGLAAPHRETVAEQQVEAALLPLGEGFIEIVRPLPGNVGVRRFLDRRGPGLHHLCVAVDDVAAALGELRGAGVELVDECPRVGALGRLIAFAHPRALDGALVELVQPR